MITDDNAFKLSMITGMDHMIKTLSSVFAMDVSLIIVDYAYETPLEFYKHGTCLRCHRKHKRKAMNLCMDCESMCLACDTKNMCHTRSHLICIGCVYRKHPLREFLRTTDKPKDLLYVEWYLPKFPGKLHLDHQNDVKREAANPVIQARKKAEQEKFDAFYDVEYKKHPLQLAREIREKLWEANKIINELAWKHPRLGIQRRPEPPYY
jgi:hypothetical protein